MPLVVVADEVVARGLPGGVEPGQGHAQVGRAQHSIEGAGKLMTIQRPEKRVGVDPEFRVDPAAGGQVGPHAKHRVLGVNNCYICKREAS